MINCFIPWKGASGGGTWTPSLLLPDLWFDAADSNSITLATGVSNWVNKGSAGINASQSDPAYQPLIVSSPPGLQSIQGHRLSLSSRYNLTGDFTIAMVVRNQGDLFVPLDSSDSPVHITYNSKFLYWSGFAGFYSVVVDSSGGFLISGIAWNSLSLLFLKREGSSGFFLLDSNESTYIANLSALQIDDIVGNRQLNLLVNNIIHEVLVYPSALSDDNSKKVQGYLAHKWGIAEKLAADHPYKSIAP